MHSEHILLSFMCWATAWAEPTNPTHSNRKTFTQVESSIFGTMVLNQLLHSGKWNKWAAEPGGRWGLTGKPKTNRIAIGFSLSAMLLGWWIFGARTLVTAKMMVIHIRGCTVSTNCFFLNSWEGKNWIQSCFLVFLGAMKSSLFFHIEPKALNKSLTKSQLFHAYSLLLKFNFAIVALRRPI